MYVEIKLNCSQAHFFPFFFKVLGFYCYDRRRRRHDTKHHRSRSEFDKDAFASSPEVNEYMAADLMRLSNSALPPESSSTSTAEDRTLGRQPQGSLPPRVANADEEEKVTTAALAFPKPVVEKGKLPRGKPTWLSPITTEELSVTHESDATVKSKTSPSSLAIPDLELVPSPARSESFAPKDLTPPSPPNPAASSTSGLDSAGSHSRAGHDINLKLPRLMNVVALFTPSLPDELRIKIGDTVRIIEEYKDGWCFVQFLGERDAPKGVVPLVCLQERMRLVPFTHNDPTAH